jgi:hypothetical protein
MQPFRRRLYAPRRSLLDIIDMGHTLSNLEVVEGQELVGFEDNQSFTSPHTNSAATSHCEHIEKVFSIRDRFWVALQLAGFLKEAGVDTPLDGIADGSEHDQICKEVSRAVRFDGMPVTEAENLLSEANLNHIDWGGRKPKPRARKEPKDSLSGRLRAFPKEMAWWVTTKT